MQGKKFQFFNGLPGEIQYNIAKYLPTSELFALNNSQTSFRSSSLFEPLVNDYQITHRLLQHVVCGEHAAVRDMLTNNSHLIFKRGRVTDCSGRTFEHISGFEYALWALDKHMWAMMLDCIPKNEEGKKIVSELLSQYNKVNTVGITYQLNGKTITEKHFDFENTIIKELQTQVDSIDAPGAKDWAAIDKQWREGVGGAQKLLPMHAVDEYFSDEPFFPVPEFTSQPESTKEFYNWATEKDENWFSLVSKLPCDFALYKGARVCMPVEGCRRGVDGCQLDLNALTALSKIRKEDFINLKLQLEELATADNYYQILPR